MYKTLVVMIVSLLGVTCALVGTRCTTSTECKPDECCQILSEIMVVSKKEVVAPVERTGTCEKYKQEGEYCDSLQKMNGFCSCALDLVCKYSPILPIVNTDQNIVASKIWGRGGKCEQPDS